MFSEAFVCPSPGGGGCDHGTWSPPTRPPPYPSGQEAGGTHPTGMHSSLFSDFFY